MVRYSVFPTVERDRDDDAMREDRPNDGSAVLGAERQRLLEAGSGKHPWRRWGPYLAERQWGTVREDYSGDGNAWSYFPHEMAVWRAYRWGEDGIAGLSDNRQRLCLALALWNGRDAILKERLFGLGNQEGNHGEDVKELYFYLDATPTHSYLKYLYKYPQAEFPYARLREESRRRSRGDPEFEILDSGVFDGDCYFDVIVEYAKGGPDDIRMSVSVVNRGPDAATVSLLPQLWFRNEWDWDSAARRPLIRALGERMAAGVEARHDKLGTFHLYGEGTPELLFTENETNPARFGAPCPGYFKDGFHDYVVRGRRNAVNPALQGTKCALLYQLTLPAGGEHRIRLRLTRHPEERPFARFDEIVATRCAEADEFYADLQAGIADENARGVHRQALAGMIWSKQYYRYDVARWRAGDPRQPPPPETRRSLPRNAEWDNLDAGEVLSMPDKWEYPWFAAWDTAFACVPMTLVDPEFAKRQLVLLTREWYQHPNGQLPAYEWDFSDVNPPVQAWAAWRVFRIDRERRGDDGDLAFLERVFHKLMLNFTWWVNRKDAQGRNIFQGGFLGLDNVGVFDRSRPLPTGGRIDQADGTAWMAMYSLNLMRIALELAQHNPVYEDIASKFFEHFLHIAKAMFGEPAVGCGLWDEFDGFYYDMLSLPDGRCAPLKARSVVGLVPLFAVEVLEPDLLARCPGFTARLRWLLENRPDLARLVSRWEEPGVGERHLLSLLRGSRMKRLLRRTLDEAEFLSPYGVRSLSKSHEAAPYVLAIDGYGAEIRYDPAESSVDQFGGNSNWRGPIWLPMNYLLVQSLYRFHRYYGDDFHIECPTGSGRYVTLAAAADEVTRRLIRLFLGGREGRRPIWAGGFALRSDLGFPEPLLFHEYFHGDTGEGLGASHQTGWTALVANLLQESVCGFVQHSPTTGRTEPG